MQNASAEAWVDEVLRYLLQRSIANQEWYEDSWHKSEEYSNRQHPNEEADPEIRRGNLAAKEAIPGDKVGHDPVENACHESW